MKATKVHTVSLGFLPILLVILTACSTMPVTPADRRFIFFPAEIENFPVENYRHKMTPEHVPYIFFKIDTEEFGFRGLYGSILISPDSSEVKYLCIVNILPAVEQARSLFSRITPEPFPSDFGMEETIDPKLYQADDVYLYRDDRYFHMVLLSSRIVYSVYLEGASVKEPQVRKGLRQKMEYLKGHLNSIR